MLSLKTGVNVRGISPQIVLAVVAAQALYKERHGADLVITSANDSMHKKNSKHYRGDAVDIRTRNLPQPDLDAPLLAQDLAKALGKDYDVLFEGDHIHIEYDPEGNV